jgi:hypothetical protein
MPAATDTNSFWHQVPSFLRFNWPSRRLQYFLKLASVAIPTDNIDPVSLAGSCGEELIPDAPRAEAPRGRPATGRDPTLGGRVPRRVNCCSGLLRGQGWHQPI